MVVSTTKQLEDTYLLWHRFSFSSDSRSWDAVAVPSWVGNKLNSAFSIIISLALVQFWTIVLSLILYVALKRYQNDASRLDPLAVTLWNKKGDLVDSLREMIGFDNKDWTRPWLLIAITISISAGVAKTAITVLVAPLIILNHAAPVNPAAVYAPDNSQNASAVQAARFALEVPRFFRALGSAVVDSEIRKKVQISSATLLGQRENGEEILRVNYSYGATGADFGIQKYFDLQFNVTGSCFTEYGWYNGTGEDTNGIPVDVYVTPFRGPQPESSLLDGVQPSAKFYLGDTLIPGELKESNSTWGAVVSSVGRKSFSIGTDPWYLTTPSADSTDANNVVTYGRPGLSCWQDDVWSYHGQKSSTVDLAQLPGLNLSNTTLGMLSQYLGTPVVQAAGFQLQTSALMSSTTSLDQIFDAGISSFHDDLERLLLTAYVATINCLTDTTLYPPEADRSVPNAAVGNFGVVPDDVDYVVWSPQIATLSTLVIIIIPTILVGTWLLAIILIYFTPVGVVAILDSSSLQAGEKESRPNASVAGDIEGAKQPEKQ
ncbi:hypothetical protein ONZ43_g1990 [Nemania bipapillata]|uniref:Uncharacterized protein n=1 Tax=Nemania bipapillata TaxID=110536 RepID=A0ACC2J2G3_9PEZI|nr:hypothetical protein ONZ43_g1990 [Nemania bipapillata]